MMFDPIELLLFLNSLFHFIYLSLSVALVAFVIWQCRKRKLPNWGMTVLVALVVMLVAWWPVSGYLQHQREIRIAKQRIKTFNEICHKQAYERITKSVADLKWLVLSPPSMVLGGYGVELFYGGSRPKKWARAKVFENGIQMGDRAGAYELRYTYQPESRVFEGSRVVFHGIKQQVVDYQSKEVIAERLNYLYGNNFNRAYVCLGEDWFGDNRAFAERVIGLEDIKSKRRKTPVSYVKAQLIAADIADRVLSERKISELTPPGTSYDVRKKQLMLPDDNVITSIDYELDVVASVERKSQYVIVRLPDDYRRSIPPLKFLLDFRLKDGQELKKVFISIPPEFDWSNGWGFDPADISIAEQEVVIKLMGGKRKSSNYPPYRNEGEYTRQYTFRASLP